MRTVKPALARSLCRIALLLGFIPLCQNLFANVGVSLNPVAVSNTYSGTVTLQVTGLTNGETVLVQKYLDANANGVVDPSDLLWQQFYLTDGNGGMVIGGVTNFNVPGDTDTTPGQITAQLLINSNFFEQSIIGQYLYVVSSPVGRWPAITNSFLVTNFPFAQKFTGNVLSNGVTPLPDSVVLLFPPPRPGHHDLGNPLGGTVANNSGAYTIQVPAGTYTLFPSHNYYVANSAAFPSLTLSNGSTITTNLSVSNTTATISGTLVDSVSSAPLPGVLMEASSSGLFALGFSTSNGTFTIGVPFGTPSQWGIQADSRSLATLGYLQYENGETVNTGATGAIISCPKANALLYGTVKDSLGNPFVGFDLDINDNNGSNLFDQDIFTSSNGKYVAGVVGQGGNDSWSININNDDAPTNYIFSQPSLDYNQNGGTNIGSGQAVQANFVGVLATQQITGQVLFEGSPVTNLQVYAYSTDTNNYQSQAITDANGDYTLNVGNDTWNVNVECQGGDNTLQSILGSGNYECPNGTNIDINNDNGTANFEIQGFNTFLSGQVLDDAGDPVTNMNIFAQTNASGGGLTFQSTTDSQGNYRMGVDPGNYTVFLNNDPDTGFPALGLVGPTIPITFTNGDNVSNFVLICKRVTGHIQVQVNGSGNTGLAGIGVNANLFLGITNYSGAEIETGNSGAATLPACNGNWQVSLDGNTVQNAGYSEPNSQNATVANNTVSVTFDLSTGNSGGQLEITTESLPNGNVGVAYNTQLDASGGSPPYSWSLAFGSASLPPGLVLGTNGVISGKPTTNGFFSFIVQVADTASASTSEGLGMIINPKPSLSLSHWGANRFSFELTGASNQNYTVQVTTNLASTNWGTLLITNNTLSNSFLITDPNATNSHRFYRALIAP